MTVMAWLKMLDRTIAMASETLQLPKSEAQAFDGDGWVWASRTYLDLPADLSAVQLSSASSRVAEVQVRARPDTLDDGLNLEIVAVAWKLRARDAAWSRACAAWHVDPAELAGREFSVRMNAGLRDAWNVAQRAANDVLPATDHRTAALGLLHGRGIPVRLRESGPGIGQ